MDILRRQHLMYGRSRVGFRFHTSKGVYDFESGALSKMVLRPFLFSDSAHMKMFDGVLMTEEEYKNNLKPVDISDNEQKLIEVLEAADLVVAVRGKYRPSYERDTSRSEYPFIYRKKA